MKKQLPPLPSYYPRTTIVTLRIQIAGTVLLGGTYPHKNCIFFRSLNVWDIREGIELHQSSDSEHVARSPTYSTAEVLKNQGHRSPIVSVIVLTKEDDHFDDDFRPIQVHCRPCPNGISAFYKRLQSCIKLEAGIIPENCTKN